VQSAVDRHSRKAVEFSLAHSGQWALLAVVQEARIGVDIERRRRGFRADDLIRRFFSEREIEGLVALSGAQLEAAFFRAWVRKEAYLKAVQAGLGVPAGLSRFSVSVDPDDPPKILETQLEKEASSFSLYDLDVPEGYVGALAVEGTRHRVRHLHDVDTE